MVGLAAATVLGIALFALAAELWAFLLLSALSGACWAAIGPLGEALALQELARRGISYGRVRLWGSLTFVLAAAGTGHLVEQSGRRARARPPARRRRADAGRLPAAARDTRPRAPPPRRRNSPRCSGWELLALHPRGRPDPGEPCALLRLCDRALARRRPQRQPGRAVWAEGVLAEILLLAGAGACSAGSTPPRLLAVAGALTVVRWSVTAQGTDLALLVPAQLLHGASFAATYLATMHYLRDHTPRALLASAQAINASLGFALLFGLVTPVAGWLYAAAGGQAFWAMAALALAGTALSLPLADARRASIGNDLQRAMSPPAEADDPEMLVERERTANVEALDQGEAGAVDDAERLIGPLLRELASTAKILCGDAREGGHADRHAVPKPHGRRRVRAASRSGASFRRRHDRW